MLIKYKIYLKNQYIIIIDRYFVYFYVLYYRMYYTKCIISNIYKKLQF